MAKVIKNYGLNLRVQQGNKVQSLVFAFASASELVYFVTIVIYDRKTFTKITPESLVEMDDEKFSFEDGSKLNFLPFFL